MRVIVSGLSAAVLALSACAPASPPAEQAPPAAPPAAQAPPVGPVAPPTTDADMIASASSAAPEAVSSNATIMTMDMRVLRKGTNGWTCVPDGPSPGVDPMCVDQNGAEWLMALMHKQQPPAGKMGFGYMLRGGSDASNTDPHATQPNPGDRWVDTGPHVMVLNIGSSFAGYPTTAENTKVPYVMFPNTPYAHLMIPVE
jgi:hypothetical protein